MNPFHIICNRAAEGSLNQHVNAPYWASPEFRARVEFEGDQGLLDRVNITLFMLKAVALDPKYAAPLLETSSQLAVMHLNFFGVSNPFPMFYVPVNSQYYADLQAAIKANMASRMFHAANRVRYWRNRSTMRSAHEDAVWAKQVAKLDLPTPADYKIDRKAAELRSNELYAQVRAHVLGVRDLRNERLAVVSRAASPGVKGWIDFLVDMSLCVLQPLWAVTLMMENGKEFKWVGTADDAGHAEGQAIAKATADTGEQVLDVLAVKAP